MSLESAITFFIAIFIFGITPGPGVFALLARALVHGSRSCFFLALGMTISDIIYLTFACLGLAAIATHWGEVFTVVRWVGAAYLLYLGYKLFSSASQSADIDKSNKAAGHVASFIQGVLISASNPKVILFYIAFLPTFINLSVLNAADIALAAVLTLVALMSGLMLIAFSAARAAKMLKTPKAVKRMNYSAGSIMMSAGIYLAASK